ncbi:glucan 1,4-alpha-glucosidase [Aestuariivirga litoralis]|uniref:glucan 1,4-alpha-glucosidase n=1 Tax=Aestuariivirga litoralis TaxID=2650924 RepID=UPI0018C7FBED|nr:glucan 1,4-alpha-glucosidase [Aestuariivirga litoralis]MBG1233274.1 glucan 1,4-alpha-glucosidase [Aestuariivirga litoralis]
MNASDDTAARLDAAPGSPGIEPRWTSSAKVGVGTALNDASPVWFTHSHGILNEIYYPAVDSACTRDFGLLVLGPDGALAEEKRDCVSTCSAVDGGIPAFTLSNTAKDGSFIITKQIVADPARACVLQRVNFKSLKGKATDYKIYALIAPHLVNAGKNNSAWISEHQGHQILFASGQSRFLAVASSLGWRNASAGFAGTSDGWTQLKHQGTLIPYQRADHGNVALTGEIAFSEKNATVTLAIAFGATHAEAAGAALASLAEGFENAWDGYLAEWRVWQQTLLPLDPPDTLPKGSKKLRTPRAKANNVNHYRTSTAVLATHRATAPRGAVVASLSIPWGASKGDNDLGGYHLIWPRDLVEIAGGFLAAGDSKEALAILEYLRGVQAPSGRWPQNFWLDGEPYWSGDQMDECAFPILLADMLWRQNYLSQQNVKSFLPMVRLAAGYVLMNGPVTGEDRWEEDGGYSPFTLAVVISALLAAADFIENSGDYSAATHLREAADCWNEQIENWTLAANDELCVSAGVKSYYVRMSGTSPTDVASAMRGTLAIKNRPADFVSPSSETIISPDALALVRFGLRAADDPRITDTVKVIDHVLRKDVPQGSLWYRYNQDGYGEHDDGAPFDGTGRGRLWPLLAAERAHYEIAANNLKKAANLIATVEASSNEGGLLPEQTWDSPDIPERELFFGRPSGSAMPLAWAHAEHIKLLRSLHDGRVFDMPPQTLARYVKKQSPSHLRIWRFNNKLSSIPQGKTLRIQLGARAMIHWSVDDWNTTTDTNTQETSFGSHFTDLGIAAKSHYVVFTIFWPDDNRWEGENFTIEII